MEQPEKLCEHLLALKTEGLRALKIGWGPFGRASTVLDEAIVRSAREAMGPDDQLMVDAGGSDALEDYVALRRTCDGYFRHPLLLRI